MLVGKGEFGIKERQKVDIIDKMPFLFVAERSRGNVRDPIVPARDVQWRDGARLGCA